MARLNREPLALCGMSVFEWGARVASREIEN